MIWVRLDWDMEARVEKGSIIKPWYIFVTF